MQQVREFRIVKHPGVMRSAWAVEYGYFRSTGKQRQFMALARWTAENQTAAVELEKSLRTDLLTRPELLPAPDAAPLARHTDMVRQLHTAATADHRQRVAEALSRLTDPLLPVDALHTALQVSAKETPGGYQFYVYLPAAGYQRLLALAQAAGSNRNQMIESLLYTAGEAI